MARPDCPLCNGSGWKTVARSEDPPEEGAQALAASASASSSGAAPTVAPKSVWAVPCDCTAGDRTDRVLARARIPERYRVCDFENFETDNELEGVAPLKQKTWNQSLAQAKITVEAFVRDFPVCSEHGLLLMGSLGVGKTHLAVAALKNIVNRGHEGLYYDYADLLKEIQNSYSSDPNATEIGVIEPVIKAEVLLLDDLGSSKPSPWALETVSHILGTRYNEKRLTIITTNYLDPEFRQAPERELKPQTPSPRSKDAPPLDPMKSRTVFTLPSGEMISEYREDSFEERVGKRIRSRLYEMCRTVHMLAPDYRKEIRNVTRR